MKTFSELPEFWKAYIEELSTKLEQSEAKLSKATAFALGNLDRLINLFIEFAEVRAEQTVKDEQYWQIVEQCRRLEAERDALAADLAEGRDILRRALVKKEIIENE